MRARWDQRRRFRPSGGVLVLALGVLASVLACAWLRGNAARADRQHFMQLTERLMLELERREQLYEYGLRGTASVFAASKNVERDEFRKLVEARDIQIEFPGSIGIGFIKPVQREALSEFEAKMRAVGAPNFTVKTSGDHDELMVMTYLEPEKINEPAIGFDIAQEPRRRAAAEQAARTGKITLSEPLVLVQDTRHSQGFLILKPLYAQGSEPQSEAERLAACTGWVFMPLRAREMFAGVSSLAGNELRFAVFDGEDVTESAMIYRDDELQQGADTPWCKKSSTIMRTENIDIAGQKWTVAMCDSESFQLESRSNAWIVLVFGIIVAGLLGWLMNSSRRMLLVARQIAVERTVELVRTQERTAMLALVAERTSNAVVITDPQERITWVNDAFTRVTGYTLEDVKGKEPGPLLQHEKTDAQTLRQMKHELKHGRSYKGTILNRGKDGREYWLAFETQPLRDALGVVTGFLSVESDITAEKERQREMESAYAALEEAQRMGKFGNWEYNVAAGTLRWSKQLFRLFGRDVSLGEPAMEDAIGEYCDADMPRLREAFERALESGEPFNLTLRTRHGHCGVRYIRVMGRPRCDELGRIVAVFGTAMDVTDEVEREESLRQVQERWTFAVEGSGDGVWDWNITTGDMVLSTRYKEMLGYEDGDLMDRIEEWASLVHRDDLPEARERLAAHFDQKTPTYSIELRMRCKDGSLKWVLARGLVVRRDAEGRPLRMVGTHTDVSERKNAELALRETTSYLDVYKKIIDHHAIVAETDVRGTIVGVNDAFCRISGYSREELLGKNHRMLNSGAHPKSMWTEMYRTIMDGGFWHGEVCNRAKDGSLYWVDTTIAPLHDESGKARGFFAIRADITGLRQARAQAEAASRSKSEFLANMSHEIRTPMTAILGYADLLADDPIRPLTASQRAEYVETIKRNGDHLLAIISDILDISKIEAGKLEVEAVETRPEQIVHDVISLMSIKARGKGLSLVALADTPVPNVIKTDPVRLRQVLMNLVGNAIKFTESGGVLLRIGMAEQPPGEPSRLRFEITDTGIGISPEHQPRLFGAFAQADASTTRRFGGTGLGLQISKRLAVMMGGDISLRSSPGEGSTFTFTITTGPLEGVRMIEPGQVAEAVRELRLPAREESNAKPLEGVRVLLAEDGPDNQRLISYHLRKAGADVRIVENGLRLVETMTLNNSIDGQLWLPPPVDVILTDMQMPELDGYQAAQLLREMGCTLPIVALTAHAMAGDAERCFAAGCDAYTTKPIDKHKLIETCRAAAAGELKNGRQAA